jgi:hypothetical protein
MRRLALLLAALALAGCGESTEEALERWRGDADAICARAERTVRAQQPARSIADLERAMVRAAEEARRAMRDIRAIELPDDAHEKARPFLNAMALVERDLGRAEDAAAARDAKQVGAAARSIRLNAIDVDAEARRAGLDVCGQERTGVAAADAIVTPAYAERLADAHAYYVGALAALRRRYLLSGRPLGRFRYWQGVELLADRVARRLESEAPTRLEDRIAAHFEEVERLREQAEWLVSTVTGEIPVQDDPITIPQARRQVEKVRRSGFALLKATGPPGEELIGAVRNAAQR